MSLPGPSAVEGLQASGSSESLDVSWKRGPGRADGMRVLLIDSLAQSTTVNETLETTVTSHSFKGLIPGHHYNVSVATVAGNQTTLVSISTQTGTGQH